MNGYIDCLKRTVTNEATRLLAITARLNISTSLSFLIADAVRAVNGEGDEIVAGIELDIECLRVRGEIEGFNYDAQIAQYRAMLHRIQHDSAAYLQELIERERA